MSPARRQRAWGYSRYIAAGPPQCGDLAWRPNDSTYDIAPCTVMFAESDPHADPLLTPPASVAAARLRADYEVEHVFEAIASRECFTVLGPIPGELCR